MVMLPCPGCPSAFRGCGAEPAAHTGLESWCQGLPGEEMLRVQGWAVLGTVSVEALGQADLA